LGAVLVGFYYRDKIMEKLDPARRQAKVVAHDAAVEAAKRTKA
jgi:hypothetical protein